MHSSLVLFIQLHVASFAAHLVSVVTDREMLSNLALSLENRQDDVGNQHQTVPDANKNISVSRSFKGVETQVDSGERQDCGDVTKSPI